MTLRTTGIDHVNLKVKNLSESIKFWEKLLGFQVLEDMPEIGGAIIGTKEAKLALYEKADLGSVAKQGFSHVCFHIKNFDQAKQFCEDNGIPVLHDGIIVWPKSRSLYIQDPNGYEIELAEVWGGGLV